MEGNAWEASNPMGFSGDYNFRGIVKNVICYVCKGRDYWNRN
jgi:hypothetical protein